MTHWTHGLMEELMPKLWDGWESNTTAEQNEKRAISYLLLFSEHTYGIEVPHELALFMEQRGWIDWVPPKFGTTLYQITDAGRAKLTEIRGCAP